MKSAIYIYIVLIAFYSNAFSQIDVEFNNQTGYLQNSFNGSVFNSPVSMNSINFTLIPSDNFNLWGGGGLTQYFNIADRNYFTLFAGTGYSSYLNEKENSSMSLYATILTRESINTDDLSDTKQYYAGLNYTQLLDEGFIFNSISDFKYKTFTYINELDFIENKTGILLNKSFQTKTAVKIIGNLHTKFYYAIPDDPAELKFSRNNKLVTDFGTTAFQIRYALQIAQNLFETTGISFSYEGNMALNNYDTPIDYIGFDFAGDSEFFDDPYSFVYSTFQIKLTHILPLEIKASATISNSVKEYNYEVELAEDNYKFRDDKFNMISLGLERRFVLGESFVNNLILKLDYLNFNNSSNFSVMNYKGSYFLLGIELDF